MKTLRIDAIKVDEQTDEDMKNIMKYLNTTSKTVAIKFALSTCISFQETLKEHVKMNEKLTKLSQKIDALGTKKSDFDPSCLNRLDDKLDIILGKLKN